MNLARTTFIGSQAGGSGVIDYGYTDSPLRLLTWDIYHSFRLVWSVPWMVIPLRPHDTGTFSELAPTRENLRAIFLHTFLVF